MFKEVEIFSLKILLFSRELMFFKSRSVEFLNDAIDRGFSTVGIFNLVMFCLKWRCFKYWCCRQKKLAQYCVENYQKINLIKILYFIFLLMMENINVKTHDRTF